MADKGPTFLLLDERRRWGRGETPAPDRFQGVSEGRALRLAARTGGPLSLVSPDGSLGRLALPRGMAIDAEGTLYLLPEGETRILRFDAAAGRFAALPAIGDEGGDARQFCEPGNIAIAGRSLYVADTGNRRVQAFDLPSLALRHVWGPWDWSPADLASHGGAVYILDARGCRIYRHRPGTDTLELVVQRKAGGRWERLAVDRDGRLYVLSPDPSPRLEVYDGEGRHVRTVCDAGDVRDRFDPPPVLADHKGRFCLPEDLARLCGRQPAEVSPPVETPLAACPPAGKGGLVFDRHGNPAKVDPTEPTGGPPYERQGTWLSDALNSAVYRCQWHRVEMELGELPPGCRVVVSSYSDQSDAGVRPEDLPADLWTRCFEVVGPMRQPGQPDAGGGGPHEFLVQSREGQFLWLRIELRSDGNSTPAITALRVHFPRESYLHYLPAVFSVDGESKWFLERFMSVFQTEWDALEQRIDEVHRLFDPESTPDEFLPVLASWLALPLEGEWRIEQQRRLLAGVQEFYPRRGTLKSLRSYLQIYVQNIAGLEPEEQRGFPRVVEGFRARQRLMLSRDDPVELGRQAALWGPGIVGRLQLDVFAREGEVRLVSTGDPERDLFHFYAHRFQVFVPAAWIRTAGDERMLRRGLDAEKPAHTQYDLCLVEPRFRVGVQSTVGIDTIIGDVPLARLACRAEERHGDDDQEPPPSAQPRNRLGYDTVLARGPADGPTPHLLPGTRVGIDTTLG